MPYILVGVIAKTGDRLIGRKSIGRKVNFQPIASFLANEAIGQNVIRGGNIIIF